MREEVADRRSRRPRTALAVLLAGLVIATLVPSVAAAQDGCDIPVLVNTTENDVGCEGSLEEVTGVDSGSAPEQLPPDVSEPDPLVKRNCGRTRSTGPIRAENVDCTTARGLAARSGRTRTFRAFGFTCRGSGLPALRHNCFRPARKIDTGPNDDEGDEIPAAYVLFVRTR